MTSINRLNSWIDKEGIRNASLERAITEDAMSFEVFRNVSNDGFTDDGIATSIGVIDGRIIQSKDGYEIITSAKMVMKNDLLKAEPLEFRVVETNKSEDSDANVLKVVKING